MAITIALLILLSIDIVLNLIKIHQDKRLLDKRYELLAEYSRLDIFTRHEIVQHILDLGEDIHDISPAEQDTKYDPRSLWCAAKLAKVCDITIDDKGQVIRKDYQSHPA